MTDKTSGSHNEVPQGAIFLPENIESGADTPDVDALISTFLSLDWEQSEAALDMLEQAHEGSPLRLYDRLQFALLAGRGGVDDDVIDAPAFTLLEVRRYQYGLVDKRRRQLAQAAMR